MKSAPTAYTALKEAKAKAAEEASKAAKLRHDVQKQQEHAMYLAVVKGLKPYNEVELEGKEVEVAVEPSKNIVKVMVNGRHWLSFEPERHWSHCSCENVCDCESTSWITLSTIQHRKDGTKYHCWFGCDEQNMNDETALAAAMMKMMTDYDWEYGELDKQDRRKKR